MNISLHIERLVVDGLVNIDRHRFAASVQRELIRLMQAESSIASSHTHAVDHSQLDGGEIKLGSSVNTEDLGRQTGGALYGALERVWPAKPVSQTGFHASAAVAVPGRD